MANTGKYAGSETEKNLYAAFAGETQARSKYTYFASVAKKQGFEQIAELFQRTADNEKEHAKLWFEELGGLGDTADNLLNAAEGENYEWTDSTHRLRRRRKGKVFALLRRSSDLSRRSKSITRSATASSFGM